MVFLTDGDARDADVRCGIRRERSAQQALNGDATGTQQGPNRNQQEPRHSKGGVYGRGGRSIAHKSRFVAVFSSCAVQRGHSVLWSAAQDGKIGVFLQLGPACPEHIARESAFLCQKRVTRYRTGYIKHKLCRGVESQDSQIGDLRILCTPFDTQDTKWGIENTTCAAAGIMGRGNGTLPANECVHTSAGTSGRTLAGKRGNVQNPGL